MTEGAWDCSKETWGWPGTSGDLSLSEHRPKCKSDSYLDKHKVPEHVDIPEVPQAKEGGEQAAEHHAG